MNTFNKVLSHPNVRFFGNVTIGEDVTLKELMENYDAILLVSRLLKSLEELNFVFSKR